MLPVAVAALVFLVAFIVDPGAVVRLAGLGLTGRLGAWLQIATLTGLVVLGAAALLALRAPSSSAVAGRRKPADNRARRGRKGPAARTRRNGR